eukprot:9484976-Pyramimonas_sp.AAC.2
MAARACTSLHARARERACCHPLCPHKGESRQFRVPPSGAPVIENASSRGLVLRGRCSDAFGRDGANIWGMMGVILVV